MNYMFGLLLLGLFAGWLSGMVGIGGGIVIVPALVFFFAYSFRTAQGTSIAALAPPIGLMAAYVYYRQGNVDVKAAALIALGFFVGGFLGAKTNYLLKKEIVENTLAIVLIGIGVKMLISNK
jgi:uncharacterized protein